MVEVIWEVIDSFIVNDLELCLCKFVITCVPPILCISENVEQFIVDMDWLMLSF